MYSRRDIGRIALGGVALGTVFGASGVRLGATTWSLRDLPRVPGKDNIDDLIQPLKSAGVTEIDPLVIQCRARRAELRTRCSASARCVIP